MARKYVRFNYFEVQLISAEEAVLEEIEGENLQYRANLWDMTDFLDHLMIHRASFNTNVPVGDEYSEIEKETYNFDAQRGLYSFQLSKLRETNIPAKKRFGEIKENILLNQDEYIGEFVSFIYNNLYQVAMIQSNLYGLSTKQIESVLTELRFQYMDSINAVEENPCVVRLVPIIDPSQVGRVIESDYYKRMRIRASDVMLDAVLNEDSLLSETRRLLAESAGVNIEVIVSMGRSEKTASLDDRIIRNTINEVMGLDEEIRPKIEITALHNEEAEIEIINLIEPRMTDRIILIVEPRQVVAHESLYYRFVEDIYDQRLPDLIRVLRR